LSKFTSTKVINSRWRNNDFVGEAGSTHTFPDAFHEEFLVDWALQIADGSIVITETPTTGNIQVSALTVGNIVLTGTATGNFGASSAAIIGTSPISVATSSSTSTISLNANYSTTSHLHTGTYQPFGTYITAVNGTAPIAASTDSAGISTVSLTASYATSTHNHAGVYLSSITGTSPIVASADTTGAATVSVSTGTTSATVAVGSHLHGGIYQPSGTYITAVNGTAPIAASTDTAGVATVSISTGTTSATVSLGNHTHVDFATLTGTETLTNKTLTAPKLNRALIGTSPKTDSASLTLTNTSDYVQYITGTTANILMPDVTTVPLYAQFILINDYSATINVLTSDTLSNFAQLQTGQTLIVTAVNTTSNVFTSWSYRYGLNNGLTGSGSTVLASAPSISNASISSLTLSGTTVIGGGVRFSFTSITSAGTTTTLTSSSNSNYRITGTSTQTIKLPSSYTAGHTFQIHNESTGTVTVTSSDNSVITTLVTGQMLIVVGNTSNGTTAASWNKYALQQSNEGILLASTALTITTTSQASAPTTANTQLISWTSATKANTDMWSSGGSITLPNAGLYQYSFGSRFGTSTAYNMGVYAFQGSTLVHHVTKDASTLGTLDNIEMNGIISAAAGDTFSIRVAATAASKSLSANTFLGVAWMGNH